MSSPSSNEPTTEKVTQLKKTLRKASKDVAETLLILDEISKLNVTKKLLQDTRLGKTVGKLRKHEDEKVSIASKELVEKWKKTFEDTPNSSPPVFSHSTPPTPVSDKEIKDGEGAPSKRRRAEKEEQKDNKKLKESKEIASASSDPIRSKAVELLTQALSDLNGNDEYSLQPKTVAHQIEEVLYKMFNNTDKEYKAKFRSISFNLKNPKNPDLRPAVMTGEISAHKLCSMSSHEMASKEFQEEVKKIHDYYLEASKAQQMNQTTTSMFKCGKCGSRETTYYQMQTRSADEPMTTFHTCIGCGQRWKS